MNKPELGLQPQQAGGLTLVQGDHPPIGVQHPPGLQRVAAGHGRGGGAGSRSGFAACVCGRRVQRTRGSRCRRRRPLTASSPALCRGAHVRVEAQLGRGGAAKSGCTEGTGGGAAPKSCLPPGAPSRGRHHSYTGLGPGRAAPSQEPACVAIQAPGASRPYAHHRGGPPKQPLSQRTPSLPGTWAQRPGPRHRQSSSAAGAPQPVHPHL